MSEPSVKKGDARLRIIANSRAKITDARSKIGQRAKITDARAKIETRKNTVQGRVSYSFNVSTLRFNLNLNGYFIPLGDYFSI